MKGDIVSASRMFKRVGSILVSDAISLIILPIFRGENKTPLQ